MVTPGLIDAHTHAIFYGKRHFEFEARNLGKSYRDTNKEGGGINFTVKKTREAGKEEIKKFCTGFLNQMFSCGVTTCEVKSGYGLDLETEVKILEIAQELNNEHPIDIISTYLGAHSIPSEFRGRKDEYMNLILSKVLPVISEKKLAEFCDIFVDPGFFEVDDAKKLFTEAKKLGFKLKIHSEELANTGATRLAVDFGATSCDHLIHINPADIEKLAESDTIAVLLPGTCFFLNSAKTPPVKEMLAKGVAIAIATDFNPGTCFCPKLPLIMSMAAVKYGLTAYQLLAFTTINAAYAVGRGSDRGSIEVGKLADLIIWDVDDIREIPYSFGFNLVKKIIKKGKVYEPKQFIS